MHTPVCDLLGIEYPIFAFSRSREVVAGVTNAGGMGVLGALALSPDELASELDWLDGNTGGRPYGVDIVMPAGRIDADPSSLDTMIPEPHRKWVDQLLEKFGVPQLPEGEEPPEGLLNWLHDRARTTVEVAFEHPVKLLVNALGPPPSDVVSAAHEHNALVAALVGSVDHARRQIEAGVDIIVAQGTEAGGHTGQISTMILVPEVVAAVHPTPVLAAGGIGSGRQMAAALTLGAAGVWTGSLWLTTRESELPSVIVDKLLEAGSSDTVRSRSWTGKPARLLRTAWTEAWDADDSPGALPMPLQFLLIADAQSRVYRFADENDGAKQLVGSPVGQIVGSMQKVRPVREVMEDMVRECGEAVANLERIVKARARS